MHNLPQSRVWGGALTLIVVNFAWSYDVMPPLSITQCTNLVQDLQLGHSRLIFLCSTSTKGWPQEKCMSSMLLDLMHQQRRHSCNALVRSNVVPIMILCVCYNIIIIISYNNKEMSTSFFVKILQIIYIQKCVSFLNYKFEHQKYHGKTFSEIWAHLSCS